MCKDVTSDNKNEYIRVTQVLSLIPWPSADASATVPGVVGCTKMLAVLIFDQLNDVVYLRCDHKFVRHVRSMAASQGLLGEDEVDLDEVGGE